MSLGEQSSRRYALIAMILQVTGGVEGRTRFQKIAYFVNQFGWNCFEDFRFHFFGPFSQDLTEEIESMRENGWIEESPEQTIADRTMYKYRIPPFKRSVANALLARIEDPELVKRTTTLLRTLNKFKSDDLELMSSLIFLRGLYPNAGREELLRMTDELKPRFPMSRVKEAATNLQELRPYGFKF